MKRAIHVVAFLFLLFLPLKAETRTSDTAFIVFPGTRLLPSFFIDPLECQTSGGSYFLFREGQSTSLYSSVNLGFKVPVFAGHSKSLSWEINFGAATFTQFDLLKRNDGSYLAGLLNNDYKMAGDIVLKKSDQALRFRLFHISSHPGDDYMLRHNDTIPNDKSQNYEQADLTYMHYFESAYCYVGAGEVYTPYVFRKRLSFQGGGLINFRTSRKLGLFAGSDIKSLAENEFIPDIRCAFGISLNGKDETLLRLWLDYYSGQLPYSTLDYGRVNWIGLGLKINIF